MVVYGRANRQYVAMPRRDIWSFLESQTKIYAAFQGPDGYPHASPMWFCVDHSRIYMRTHDYKVKTGLARSGKACCVTDKGERYRELRGVIIWGRSRVLDDDKLIGRINALLDKKYSTRQWKPSEMPEKWVAERRRETRAFIEVVPLKIASWDNRRVR